VRSKWLFRHPNFRFAVCGYAADNADKDELAMPRRLAVHPPFSQYSRVAAQRRKPSRDHLGGGQPPGGGLCLFFAALATRLGVGFVGLPIGIIVVAGPRVNLRPANLTAEGP